MKNISWHLIGEAISAYELMGYKYLEVPWVISEKATNITIPVGRTIIRSNDGALVGSAEQSFIQLMLDETLKPGKYVAATPCFRDEKIDELHQRHFFKVELIDFSLSEIVDVDKRLIQMMSDACRFMESIGKKQISLVKTAEGFDIEFNGIELGSYGYRSFDNNYWIYGTGIAEPRFTQALGIKEIK